MYLENDLDCLLKLFGSTSMGVKGSFRIICQSMRSICRLSAWGLTLCVTVVVLRGQSAPSSADSAMERDFQAAMAAQDRGDLGKATSMLVALRSAHPGIFAVDESLGLLYVAREDFATALPILKAATREEPGSSVAHANLGADYLKLDKSQDAVRELEIAARLNPRDQGTLSTLGQALSANGQPAAAAQAFGKAVELAPANADATIMDPATRDLRYNWAVVLLETGDADKAAWALAPIPASLNTPQIESVLGEIAEKQGKYIDAVQHLQAAAKQDPSEANIYLLGCEYLKHWTFDPAVELFEYGVAHYPASQRLLLGLGIAQYSKNKISVAAPIFAQLLDADPGNATYAILLGRSCIALPDTIKECEKLEYFAEANPKNGDVDTYAAMSILARSPETANLALASKLLDEATQADPKLADAHLEKGFLLQYQDHWRESIPELETCIALRPESSKAHYLLMLAYARTGNKAKAKEQLLLQKKYRDLEKDGMDTRYREVQMFVAASK
jgi:tetratricopeptide (TPR) repeat protein